MDGEETSIGLQHILTIAEGASRGLWSAEAETVLDRWGVKRTTALVEKDHPWAVHFWQAVGYVLDERVCRYVANRPQKRAA